MKFILKSVLLILLIITCVIVAIRLFSPQTKVSQAQLYAQANQFIQSKPSESQISVAKIWANYRQLEERWVGADNAVKNHTYLEHNSNFAQTDIFESEHTIESNLAVDYLRIKYASESHNVSGLVLIPRHQAIKGVVLYFHSTISAKLNVPSLNFTEYKAEMLAAIFAANGYIVVAPDYIGLGNDYQDTHPYILYPQPNINDGKNILGAVIPQLRAQKILNTENLPLFVSGYSEGASYALWFSRVYQENRLFRNEIKQQRLYLAHTVAIEGAYDLSGVMLPFLLSNQYNDASNSFHINTTFWGSFLKPSLMVNALLAFGAENHLNSQQLFNANFYNLDCFLGLPICGNSNNVDTLRLTLTNQFKIALNYFFAALLSSGESAYYSPLNNSVLPLINPQIIQSKLLLATAQQANILSWKSTNPITLVSLAHDSLVPENNSAHAYTQMSQAGSQQLNYIRIANQDLHARSLFGANIADHVSFELYALLIALHEFESTPFTEKFN